MRLFRSALYPAAACILVLCSRAEAQVDSTVKADTSARTIISQEQAVRGMTVFTKTCVECHTKTDITGADFKLKWSTRPVFDLFQVIRTTMPDDKPGSMTQEQYIDVVAYILRINGAQAGGMPMLPTDTTGLKKWRMDILVPSPTLDSVKTDSLKLGAHSLGSTATRIGINHLFSRQVPKN